MHIRCINGSILAPQHSCKIGAVSIVRMGQLTKNVPAELRGMAHSRALDCHDSHVKTTGWSFFPFLTLTLLSNLIFHSKQAVEEFTFWHLELHAYPPPPADFSSSFSSYSRNCFNLFFSVHRISKHLSCSIVQWPDTNALVVGASCQKSFTRPAVIWEGHTVDGCSMVVQHCQWFHFLPAKDPDAIIPPCRCQYLPVLTDGNIRDPRIDEFMCFVNLRGKVTEQTKLFKMCLWKQTLWDLRGDKHMQVSIWLLAFYPVW